MILADDMGYSDLGCYGGEIQTPNLDQPAENGIRYMQMYNTSKCGTTRISLLTGLYHQRSGRDFSNTALAGEVLRPAGYRTWWSGKHHARFNPYERGFDHFSAPCAGDLFLVEFYHVWSCKIAIRPPQHPLVFHGRHVTPVRVLRG